MEQVNPNINEQWKVLLKEEFESVYFSELKKFLIEERSKYTVYPPGNKIFNAFDRTPPDTVKVVILGQDPYHGAGQAHGLCFSVTQGVKPPPSLVNIFKELNNDLGIPMPTHGNLEKWAEQGVLLLNATLTVRENSPRSHFNHGWEKFTDSVIKKISETREGLIFMLWGNDAKAKEHLIDMEKHHILKASHPSPFSAYDGFFGCKHFSQTNQILVKQGQKEIDWRL